MSELNRLRVDEILRGFADRSVIVLGDVMLDEFVWGKVRRISPEAPVPIVEVTGETYRLGGAANVVANVHALGGNVLPLGVLGNDRAAEQFLELLSAGGIESGGLIRDARPTTLKTRVLAHNQQIARTDRESRAPLGRQANQQLAELFANLLPRVQAVIVSDYDKGVINADLLGMILPRAKAQGIPIFLDPKVHHADYYRPVTMITPNHREAELLTGMVIQTDADLEEAGRRLRDKFGCPYALITRGEEGMSLFTGTGSHHLPTFAREVFDVTGAGDTVIATLTLAHCAGATMKESAILANHAAGIAVGKIGTATVSREELAADFDMLNAGTSS